MNSRILPGIALCALMSLSAGAASAPLSVAADDTVQKVLEGQAGKRVTVRLRMGEELTGTVKTVSADVVHLGEIAGKEFYDAVVATKAIDAVIIRVKD